MKVEQIYTGCLAEAAYYIESKGEIAIIDPLRETKPYIDRAKEAGGQIKYIFETHFHADFVSGHVGLAEKTGATIVFGPNGKTEFDSHTAKDGEEFKLGDVTIRVLHTPGHTMESTTYLLVDEKGKDYAIFTGDTLFIGDVGRPDLAVKTEMSQADLAGHLFDSLRNKIMPLGNEVIVYPAHGAGSACGKNMSSETFATLGNQKEFNYALRADMTKEEFIKEVTTGLLPPPQYFPKNVMLNKTGYASIDKVMEKGSVAMDPETFEAVVNNEGAIVLDTRDKLDYIKGHIPNSIFIGIDGSFAPWVGALITDLDQAIVLVVEPGREKEVVMRLSRVGYDNCLGYLEGGLEAWTQSGRELDTLVSIEATELAGLVAAGGVNVVDVRKPGEYEAEHMKDVLHLPLDYINAEMNKLERDRTYHLHCRSGYRSVIAASILKARGYKVVDVAGGFQAMVDTDLPMTTFACSSSN